MTKVKLVDQIRKEDPIVKYEGEGATILRQKSKPILAVTPEHAELASQMEVIMRAANGVGLAAPQLGILMRMFVFDAGDGFQAVLNPKILQRKGSQVGVEGCLSLPGLYGDVERAQEVVVKGVDANGKPVRLRGEGLAARVMQHEIDHLDGILFTDRADHDSLHWASPGDAGEDGDSRQLRE